MPLEIHILKAVGPQDSGAITVKLTGSLDTSTAPELERQLAPVLAGNARECQPHQVAAAGATDTDAVLGDAGFDATEIARLRRDGVVE